MNRAPIVVGRMRAARPIVALLLGLIIVVAILMLTAQAGHAAPIDPADPTDPATPSAPTDDPGLTIEVRRGSRWMQTFRKLPMTRPSSARAVSANASVTGGINGACGPHRAAWVAAPSR